MMIKITLPDGSVREYEKGTTAMQVATSISEGLARNVLAAKLNSVVVDANTTIKENSTLSLLTWNDDDGKNNNGKNNNGKNNNNNNNDDDDDDGW